MKTWIRIKTEEQLRAALESNVQVQCLIVDSACRMDLQKIRRAVGENCKIYLQLPDVLRQKRKEQILTLLQQADGFDGLVVKNLDELGLVLEEHAEQRFEIIADAFLYAYNKDAIRFYRELIPNLRFVCSDELTDREIDDFVENTEDFIYKVYGYQQVMITAQCFYKNYAGCDADSGSHLMTLRDEAGNDFYAVSECGQCYSVIYNGVPTNMLDKDTGGYENILYDFTIESTEQVRQVLTENTCGAYTRGHHRTGVD